MRENSNNNNNMQSLYEENSQFGTPNSTTNGPVGLTVASVKRPVTLDFDQKHVKRRAPFNNALLMPAILNSPDLNKLGISSPDLEKFIMGNATIQTPTPGIFSTKATTEQIDFSKGFEEALNSLHSREKVPNTICTTVVTTSTVTNTMSGGEITSYTNLDSPYPIAIKDEPQNVPQSPPVSPINMENQERIKLERKRMRNRVAASKCRKRKLERISKLEDKVRILKSENAELGSVIANLKTHVIKLKQQVIEHVNSGCQIHMKI